MHLKHIENLTKNVGKLTESTSQGFGLLRQVLFQPYVGPPQHFYSNNNTRKNMFSSPLSYASNIAVTPPENNMQEASRNNFSFARSSSHHMRKKIQTLSCECFPMFSPAKFCTLLNFMVYICMQYLLMPIVKLN